MHPSPYKGQRYDVSKWHHGHQLVGMKEMFNHAYSSLKNVIEWSFEVLKMKWRILLNLPSYLVNKHSKIIAACISLHNSIREDDLEDPDFASIIQDDSSRKNHDGGTADDVDMDAFCDVICYGFVI